VKWALEQDRDVFAVPGILFSENSEGPNWLIQQGARLVMDYRDILDELGIAPAEPEHTSPQPAATQAELGVDILARENNGIDIENRVLRHLVAAGEPAHVDDITRAVGSPAPEVSSVLTVLELKGAVTQVGRMLFVASKVDARGDS
jgi:DNA processing protein